MSQRMWCAECGKGQARKPQAEQRVMFFNGEPIPLAQGHFDCDNCGAPIRPGDPAVTWTVWTEMMNEPALWETQFLELV